jgi:hypothetical protein
MVLAVLLLLPLDLDTSLEGPRDTQASTLSLSSLLLSMSSLTESSSSSSTLSIVDSLCREREREELVQLERVPSSE